MTPRHPQATQSAVPDAAVEPLGPVRRALLAAARADAERLLADADADAAAVVARAGTEADRIRSTARTQGEADAAAVLVAERARARRRARSLVLAAQRETFEELRAQVARALPALRGGPGYDGWRKKTSDEVRTMLGDGAEIVEHPDGGVVGHAPGRRVAVTLTGVADEVITGLGADLEGLWSP